VGRGTAEWAGIKSNRKNHFVVGSITNLSAEEKFIYVSHDVKPIFYFNSHDFSIFF